MHFEEALEALGRRFGLFQIVLFSLLCIPYIFQAVFYLSYVFTTMRSEYRCFVPECDSDAGLDAGDMDPPWLQFAVPPGQEGRCRRYVPVVQNSSTSVSCTPEEFSAKTQPCDRWVYPNKHLSIMTEWDITCYSGSEYQMTMVGTMNNVGRILGLPLLGYFSDRFGRRVALLTQIAVSVVLGLSRSFATDYVSFISLEFLDPIFYDGIGAAAFIMGMELMPTRLRGLWTALSHVLFGLGQVLLGVLAWAVPYWRWLLRILYSAALVSLPALWLLPESVHWLVSKGRTEDAQVVLRKAASMNKCDELNFHEIRHTALPDQDDCNETSSTNSFSEEMKEMIQSKILLFRAINCSLSWMLVMLVYDGLAVYSVSMSGNPYLNFILVVVVEVPASLISWLLLTRLSRRLTLCAPLLLTAVFCFTYHFLPTDNAWYRVIDVMLAKLCVTVGFTVLYVLSAEVFPTKVRHFMYNFCSMMGRSGSMLAPQGPLLSVYLDSLPLFVFSFVMLIGAGLALCFPETAHSKLPDCVREAEAMGRKPPPARDA